MHLEGKSLRSMISCSVWALQDFGSWSMQFLPFMVFCRDLITMHRALESPV